MNLADVLARIPYLRVHELSVDAGDGNGAVQVRMPVHREVTNHLGIMHAGALFTAAETAAGVAAWCIVPADRAYVLLRGAQIRYTRRAEGDVVASAHVADGQAETARAAFDDRGRADAVVEVSMTDPAGETVFEGSFDYALRPRQS